MDARYDNTELSTGAPEGKPSETPVHYAPPCRCRYAPRRVPLEALEAPGVDKGVMGRWRAVMEAPWGMTACVRVGGRVLASSISAVRQLPTEKSSPAHLEGDPLPRA